MYASASIFLGGAVNFKRGPLAAGDLSVAAITRRVDTQLVGCLEQV